MIAIRWSVSILAAACFIGCDDQKPTPDNVDKKPDVPVVVNSGKGDDPTRVATGAAVIGKATFEGTPPKPKAISMAVAPQCAAMHANPIFEEVIVVGAAGELKNVVVYVKDGARLGGAAPTTPVILDQQGCIYTPHVVTVMVGQDLKAKNSDGFLHNVHGLCKENPEFNIPQQQKNQINKLDATQAPETFLVKCDIHPWMNAWVVVLDHPFSAVSGEDGTFAIKGLKDGKYTLVAWHQKLGTQEAEIEVKNGKATADFKFAPKK